MKKEQLVRPGNSLLLKIIMLTAFIFYGGVTNAYDFEVSGLYYNILSSSARTVELTRSPGSGYSGDVSIPSRVSYNGVSYSVIAIGKSAFYWCKELTGSLSLPNSIKTIGDYAFQGCSNLTGTLVLPNSLISIGLHAFDGCVGFRGSLKIPDTVTSIGGHAFAGCSGLTGSLEIPNSITTIEECTFANCSGFTGTLKIPNSVTSIGYGAFLSCSGLSGVLEIPNSVTSISGCAFMYCKGFAGQLVIPSNLKAIEDRTFQGCEGLNGMLIIPNNVTSIGESAFSGCIGIDDKLIIPNSVIHIGKLAFLGCSGLAIVESQIDNPYNIDNNVFQWISSSAKLYVPKGSVSKYEMLSGWTTNFSEILEMGTMPTTYTLSVTASGYGSVSYGGSTIRSKTSSFTVNAGTSATITFSPDNGYRIKSVKVNNMTVSDSNNLGAIDNSTGWWGAHSEKIKVGSNETFVSSFTNYNNGVSNWNNFVIVLCKEDNSEYAVLRADNYGWGNGYGACTSIGTQGDWGTWLAAMDGAKVTTYVTNNGDGTADIKAVMVGNDGNTYTQEYIGINTIDPDNFYFYFTVDGCHLEFDNVFGPKYNSTGWWGAHSDIIQYTINSITDNTIVSVEFEAIPITTYTLSITASGNGSVSYNGNVIKDKMSLFSVNEGTSATIAFSPDTGYRIKNVKVNGTTVSVSNNQYTINSINRYTTVEVEFEEILQALSVDDVNYRVVSVDEQTIRLAKGNYGIVLEVPAKVSYQNAEWTVTGIDNGALDNNSDLAAIIWHPEAAFTEQVSNSNLLLYVDKAEYAPSAIKNVVVNGSASSITLTDAASGNDFYCPQEFTAQRISYTHNYEMKTGIGKTQGWETIALPFDVQKVTHQSKGEIVSFAKWKSGDAKKPFWLMELSSSGWKMAESIKANTPYIISMPNNEEYKSGFLLNGSVTFSAENVNVAKTENLSFANYSDRTFVPTFASMERSNDVFALNVVNDIERNNGGATEGSSFERNLRVVHPFEAYMTSTSSTRSIGIDEGMATGIIELITALSDECVLRIYNLNGQLIKREEGRSLKEVMKNLPAGVYIVNGKKMIMR